MEYQYDLVVIGGGPAGYEGALEAAALGMKTALVESRQLGGTCLNRGCIPTKALAHAAGLYAEMKACGQFGLMADKLSFDMKNISDYKNQTVETLRSGIALRLKQHKVDVYSGMGKVTAPHCVRVQEDEGEVMLTAKNILTAAGSAPITIPIPGADLPQVVTSDGLLEWDKPAPNRLLIIGGGVIGVELASIFANLGSSVVIVEALDRLLANMDRELGQSVKLMLKKRGIESRTSARVESIEAAADGGVICHYTEKDTPMQAEADLVLMAVGRRSCGLSAFDEGCQPQNDRGRIVVDGDFKTSVDSVYAVGDAIGGMQLAHVATAQALCAVRHMAGKPGTICLDTVPSCVYLEPEIACVGMTADEAKAKGIEAQSAKYVMSANGKTVLTHGDRGFIKVVYEKDSQRILGAQMMCARATDMIGQFATAVVCGLTVQQMALAIRPHPTFEEAIGELMRGQIK